jgi:hypothetical protein
MRILNFVLAIMFLLFAFVQVNDPDPALWILIYGAMSVVCILAIFEFFPRKVLFFLLVLYAALSVLYFPGLAEWLQTDDKAALFDDVAKMDHPYIEESREFLGLMICILVLAFYLIRSRRTAKA